MQVKRSTGFTESSGGSRMHRGDGRFNRGAVRSGGRGDEGESPQATGNATRTYSDRLSTNGSLAAGSSGKDAGGSNMNAGSVHIRPSTSSVRTGYLVKGLSEEGKYPAERSFADGGVTPKQKKLLREALEFLGSAAGSGVTAERALKSLFALYEGIDPFADYIKPGEREFFPVLRAERTLERFLEGFKYIYYILRRAEERVRLGNAFDNFWARCTKYLAGCGYSEKYISDICGPESIFYRQSFAWWRREYGDQEEGFQPMYEYFRACFGVEGNDDYCAVGGKDGVSYDWRRMKACCERERAEQARPETVIARPEWEEWSERNRKRMRDLVESLRSESPEEMPGPPEADLILAEIRRRNRERGYFV